MNKMIESGVEEDLRIPQTDNDWQQQDLDSDDMATAISDAHDDPC